MHARVGFLLHVTKVCFPKEEICRHSDRISAYSPARHPSGFCAQTNVFVYAAI
jgi:hypothetical protein